MHCTNCECLHRQACMSRETERLGRGFIVPWLAGSRPGLARTSSPTHGLVPPLPRSSRDPRQIFPQILARSSPRSSQILFVLGLEGRCCVSTYRLPCTLCPEAANHGRESRKSSSARHGAAIEASKAAIFAAQGHDAPLSSGLARLPLRFFGATGRLHLQLCLLQLETITLGP